VSEGESMTKHAPFHPGPFCKLDVVMDTNGGNKIRSDAKTKHDKPSTSLTSSQLTMGPTTEETIRYQRWVQNSNKRKFGEWMSHHAQCQPRDKRGVCAYKFCPGKGKKKIEWIEGNR